MPEKAIQDRYEKAFSHCYGCGHLNEHGHQLKSYEEGKETVAHFMPQPYHIAVPGYVYGGLIASLIDCHGIGTAAAAAMHAQGKKIEDSPPRFVTASLKVDYLRPTPLGPELELRAKVAELKERKAVVQVVLYAEGKACAKGEVVAVLMPKGMEG